MKTKAECLKKRKDVEAYIHKFIKMQDPSGYNTKILKEFFASLSDDDFYQWMCDLRDGKQDVILYAPNMKVPLKIRDLQKTADALGVKLFERIRIWDNVGKRYFMTAHKYCVLQLPVRRLKQNLMSKMSVPESDKTINPLTGQVTKPDKGSAVSLPEEQTMASKGLYTSMSELMNVRGGKLKAYAGLRASLEETGTASLNEIDMDDPVRSVVTAQALLRSMHIDNNMIDDGL